MVFMAFLLTTSVIFGQKFSVLENSNDYNMKYRIVEDFSNSTEYWEFFENNIKYVFMKTNIYFNPEYIYFEYNIVTKKRLLTIEGSNAKWIQDEDRSITCSGINRVFVIEPTGGDK